MQLEGFANDAGLDDFNGAAQAVFGAALVAHLRGQVLFLGQLTHEAGFLDRLDERLLAEAVFAHLHGADGGDAVMMVRGGNGHGVDVLAHLVEHFAVILELLELRAFLRELLGLLAERVRCPRRRERRCCRRN